MSWFNAYEIYNEKFVDTRDIHGITTPTKLNYVFSKDLKMSLHRSATRRNNNVAVICDNYKEIARAYTIPNICNTGCNYIVSDKNGFVLSNTKETLLQAGYNIHVLDLKDFENSISFNPFQFISKNESERGKDVQNIVRIIVNREESSERYFEDAERMLLSAILYYHIETCARFDITDVLVSLKRAQSRDFDNDLHNLRDVDGSVAIKLYETFNRNTGKIRNAIIASLAVRMIVFNMAETDMTMISHTFDFDILKREKQALFIVYDEKDELSKIRKLFDWALLRHFNNDCQNQMGIQYETYTMWFYDDTNKQFDSYVSDFIQTCKDCGVCLSLIDDGLCNWLKQADNQARAMVLCDVFIYLGSSVDEAKDFTKKLLSYSKQICKRDMAKVDNLPDDKCIVSIRGMHPFFETRASSQKHIFNFLHCFEE